MDRKIAGGGIGGIGGTGAGGQEWREGGRIVDMRCVICDWAVTPAPAHHYYLEYKSHITHH